MPAMILVLLMGMYQQDKAQDINSRYRTEMKEESTLSPENADTDLSSLQEAEIMRVVDGDTLLARVNGKKTRIRLTGINAPESVHPDESKNTEEGRRSSAYLKSLIQEGDKVYLEYDISPQDQHGRDLCYVYYVEDGELVMLNEKMLLDGYAYTIVVEPNVKYRERFAEDMKQAKKNKAGLWQEKMNKY